MKNKKLIASVLVGASGLAYLAGCGSGLPGNASLTPTYVQIERLARPAINEGLVITNDYLNAFNSIPPSADLSSAASAVVAEAATVLGLINKVATAVGYAPPSVANVAGGFLPDVMRIDTGLALTATGSGATAIAYNHFTNDNVTKPIILIGGRKLTDNTAQITLGYLFNTDPGDAPTGHAYDNNTTYYAGTAAGVACTTYEPRIATATNPSGNPSAPGHHCLNGQTVTYGTATFPFLAKAQ